MEMMADASYQEKINHDVEYFNSYSSITVHELMIKDNPRTNAYKDFIEKNPQLFKGKVILDVGAGTGILSLFAARCGAKKVYSVEGSNIASVCEEIVKVNKYDHVVTVIHGVMEKIQLPEMVDVIISEWMGFYLLHESMLDSVLFARDRWLKDEGILLPSHATVYCCPVNMSKYYKENVEFWENVHGFDFSPIMEKTVASHLQQPCITYIKEQQLLSDVGVVVKFDLKTVKLSSIQDIKENLSFKITKDSVLHGFAFWFDINFSPDLTRSENTLDGTAQISSTSQMHCLTLSTSPGALETHWKQTVCFLPTKLSVEEDTTIFAKISLCQDDSNKRHYNIVLKILEDLEDSDDDYDDDIFKDHPVPCNCDSGHCRLISALVEQYNAEQRQLTMEAE